MSTSVDFSTPAQAVRAMADAGAVFTVRRRDDALGLSFTYKVADGGDPDRCRAIIAAVKGRPAPFYEAFRAAVQDAAVGGVETTPTRVVGEEGAETPSIHPNREREVSTTPSRSLGFCTARRGDEVGGAEASPTRSANEGGVSAPPFASVREATSKQIIEDVSTSPTRTGIEGDVETSPAVAARGAA